MSVPSRWQIVGGTEKGGIIVRSGVSLSSPCLPERLCAGATVEELERHNDRLFYRLVSGSGPQSGWISINSKGKILAQPFSGDKTSQEDAQTEHGHKHEKFDPYKLLGIKADATDAVIKSAYRKASLKVHPDRNPSLEASTEFRKLTEAREFLLNPMKRLMYNVKHKLVQRTYEEWWSDWDQIFDEMDPDEDRDGDAETLPAPLTSVGDRTDILIFGATGIAGALACKMLHGQFLSRTWAIVGRDQQKLSKVAEKFGDSPFFRGATCVETFDGVEQLVRTARVVIDFSGPKWKIGTGVAEACASSGVHYIDNTLFPGDLINARNSREKLNATARSTGACLVYFCGYATQADIAVLSLVRHFREKFGVSTRRVDSYEHTEGFMLSGTSMLSYVGPPGFVDEVARLGGSYMLGGLRPCGRRDEDTDEKEEYVHLDALSGMYVIWLPFQDRAIVRCSSGLLDDFEPYGENFLYKNYSVFPEETTAANIAFGNFMCRKRYHEAVAAKKLVPVGAGPKERLRRECINTKIFVGEADTISGNVTGTKRMAHFVATLGPGNMGEPYECTTLVALTAAQFILTALDNGSEGQRLLRPGFGTPAFHLAHLGFCEKLMSLPGWNMTEMREGLPPRELFENVTHKTLQLEV